MKMHVLFISIALASSVFATSAEYHPLVEQGKTWKYVYLDDTGWAREPDPNMDGTLRISEKETIDGLEYYAVRQYSRIGNDDFKEDGIVAYLREDREAERVWCLTKHENVSTPKYPARMFPGEFSGDPAPRILYDFANPREMEYVDVSGELQMFTAQDGSQRKSYTCFNRIMITEGIGYLGKAKEWSEETTVMTGDIFGETPLFDCVPDGPYYVPILYEVTEADGTVVYSNENIRELASVGATEAAGEGCRIEVNGKSVRAHTGNGALGEISVTCAGGGMTVRRFNITDSDFTFSIEGYMPGVYVVKCGDAIRKIAVK